MNPPEKKHPPVPISFRDFIAVLGGGASGGSFCALALAVFVHPTLEPALWLGGLACSCIAGTEASSAGNTSEAAQVPGRGAFFT